MSGHSEAEGQGRARYYLRFTYDNGRKHKDFRVFRWMWPILVGGKAP